MISLVFSTLSVLIEQAICNLSLTVLKHTEHAFKGVGLSAEVLGREEQSRDMNVPPEQAQSLPVLGQGSGGSYISQRPFPIIMCLSHAGTFMDKGEWQKNILCSK